VIGLYTGNVCGRHTLWLVE